MENNRGQAMIMGILMLVMAVIVFIAVLPAISNVIDTTKQCDNLNCEGFVDSDASSGATCSSTNRSYMSDETQNDFACTILDLGIPYLILAVLIGLVTKLVAGKMVDPVQPEYGYAPQY